MRYRISRLADADIQQICAYIAQGNSEAAEEMDQRLHRAIELLAEFPGIGHARSDVNDPRYRFWCVGQYLVGYRIERGALVVVRVLHGARDFRKLFK